MNAPAESAALADPLVIAGQAYRSRLLVGTGKYRDFAQTRDAVVASGAQIVTVAIRRTNLGPGRQRAIAARRAAAVGIHVSAEQRGLLHGGRRGAHAEARARIARRPRADEARSAGRRAYAVPRRAGNAEGRGTAGGRRLPGDGVHVRRPDRRAASWSRSAAWRSCRSRR